MGGIWYLKWVECSYTHTKSDSSLCLYDAHDMIEPINIVQGQLCQNFNAYEEYPWKSHPNFNAKTNFLLHIFHCQHLYFRIIPNHSQTHHHIQGQGKSETGGIMSQIHSMM